MEREHFVRIDTEVRRIRANQAAQKRLGREMLKDSLLERLDHRRADARIDLDLIGGNAARFARLA
jgi:hypothetical protein